MRCAVIYGTGQGLETIRIGLQNGLIYVKESLSVKMAHGRRFELLGEPCGSEARAAIPRHYVPGTMSRLPGGGSGDRLETRDPRWKSGPRRTCEGRPRCRVRHDWAVSV
jgi:hypothetical protein